MSNTDFEGQGEAGNGASMGQITINGVIFNVKRPYSAGHPLTDGEASQLNQVLAENLRNNFADNVRKAQMKVATADGRKEDDVTDKELKSIVLPEDVIETLRSEFADYAENYEFGARRGGRVLDPVEREIRRMAEEIVKGAIKAKGFKLSSVSDDQFDKLVAQVTEAKPELRAEAERRIAAAQAAADVDLSALTA